MDALDDPGVAPLDPQQAAPPPAPSTGSEFDPADVAAMLQEQSATRQTATRAALIQAQQTTPDRAADVQKLATQIGAPPDVVEQQYDALKKQAAVAAIPIAAMHRDTPALAAWATDPHNAALAHDDLPALGALEALFSPKAIAQTINAQRAAQLRTKEVMGTPLSQAERDELISATYHATLGGDLGANRPWYYAAVTKTMGLATFFASAHAVSDKTILDVYIEMKTRKLNR